MSEFRCPSLDVSGFGVSEFGVSEFGISLFETSFFSKRDLFEARVCSK